MKRLSYTLTILMLIVFGCSATLDIADINGLNKTKFEPLFIKTDIELYDLRIDIIRQTFEEQVNDSTTETKDVPYHRLGFNLGNGLFYDLNDNLSMRIDYLLNVDTKADFEIEKIYTRKRWNRIFSSFDGEFRIEYPNRKRSYSRFRINRINDSLSIYYKDKYKSTLNQTGDVLEIIRIGKKKDYPKYTTNIYGVYTKC